jgi:hypothetical protein
MEGLSNAGLLNARPTSFDGWETLTPPSPVNWGVFGRFRKLKTEPPPRVWAERELIVIRSNMDMRYRSVSENKIDA